jgi:putative SOS response-associated peptidase YedK
VEPKQPCYIHRKDHAPIAFAGLWETWHSPEGPMATCTIITTEVNELVA